MFSKRAIVLTASAGASGKKMVRTVKDSLFYRDVPYVKTYGFAVQAASWDMVKSEKKEKIERDLTKPASKIQADEAPCVGFQTKIIFNKWPTKRAGIPRRWKSNIGKIAAGWAKNARGKSKFPFIRGYTYARIEIC